MASFRERAIFSIFTFPRTLNLLHGRSSCLTLITLEIISFAFYASSFYDRRDRYRFRRPISSVRGFLFLSFSQFSRLHTIFCDLSNGSGLIALELQLSSDRSLKSRASRRLESVRARKSPVGFPARRKRKQRVGRRARRRNDFPRTVPAVLTTDKSAHIVLPCRRAATAFVRRDTHVSSRPVPSRRLLAYV